MLQLKTIYILQGLILLSMISVAVYGTFISFRQCESCKMYSENAEHGVLGLYYPDKNYYCVWMQDQTEEQIKDVEKHEYCHWLIDQDSIHHFCKGYI